MVGSPADGEPSHHRLEPDVPSRFTRERRAVEWLAENSLIDDDSAGHFLTEYSDPELP